jgi:hypothetical protein
MKNIFYVLLVFALFSCSRPISEQKTVSLITIDADNITTFKLSNWFSEVSYIPLSDSLLISTIERAKIYGDKLFLLTNKSVLVFDANSGKELLSIRHLGKGPGEYISLYDMLYDENEDIIELLDMNSKKVLRYGKYGNFINEFKISFSSFSFHKINPFTYWFYNNNIISKNIKHKLIYYDTQKSAITASYFPIDKHIANYFFTVEANNFGSTSSPSFNFCPSDTIYGFTKDNEPYAKYVLNLGRHHTPQRFYKEDYADIFDFSIKAVERNYIYAYDNVCENTSVLALSLRNDTKTFWTIYDKNTKKALTVNKLLDDYHSDSPVDIFYGNNPLIMDNEYLYFFLQPSQLIDLMETMKNKSERNILYEIFHSPDFSEQSNPIFVKCKFKTNDKNYF